MLVDLTFIIRDSIFDSLSNIKKKSDSLPFGFYEV